MVSPSSLSSRVWPILRASFAICAGLGLVKSGFAASNVGPYIEGGSLGRPPDPLGGATLFPFGLAAGDISMSRNDDGYLGPLSLNNIGPEATDVRFKFYGTYWDHFYIGNNGVLSFGAGVSSYSPAQFPVSNQPAMIAPFWGDVDTRNPESGLVWHRVVTDYDTLNSITQRLRASFLGQAQFEAKFAQITTWDRVGYFPEKADLLNTFQCVMLSDGIQSFVFFLYPRQSTWWMYGSASGNVYPQVGFQDGGGNYYNAAGTRTVAMRDLWYLTRAQPASWGTQVFKIDGIQITESPTSDGGTEPQYLPPKVIFDPNAAPTTPLTQGYISNGIPVDALQLGTATTNRVIRTTANLGLSYPTPAQGQPALTDYVQFNKLIFDDPSQSVTFANNVVAITNAANAIRHGNVIFTDTSALVPRHTNSVNYPVTLQGSSKIMLYAPNSMTANAGVNFGPSTSLNLRGFSTEIGPLNSTSGGTITSSAGTLNVNVATEATYRGSIGSALNLVKKGAGTQILAGTSSYTGTTRVSEGTLRFAKSASLYNNTPANWTAAKFTVAYGATASFHLNGAGEFTAAQIPTLLGLGYETGGRAGLHITTGDVPYAGNITNVGLGLVKSGAGNLTLSGNNTYTGGTTLEEGMLGLGSNTAIGTGPLTIRGGEIRAVGDQRTLSNPTTLAGSFKLGRLTDFAGPVTLVDNITITSGNPNTSVPTTSTFSGGISGYGGITFTEASSPIGKIVLAGNNTYLGSTNIDAGKVSVGSATALPSTTILSVETGAELHLDSASPATVRMLALGGLLMNAGEWGAEGSGAPYTSPLLKGNGRLMVTEGASLYQVWSYRISDQTKRGINTDGDNDGSLNLFEYAFGTDPQTSQSTLASESGGVIVSRGNPTPRVATTASIVDYRGIFVRRKDRAVSGLVYTPQFSNDLVSWFNNSTTPTVLAQDSEVEIVSVPYPFFLPDGKKARFFRVQVTMP